MMRNRQLETRVGYVLFWVYGLWLMANRYAKYRVATASGFRGECGLCVMVISGP